MQRHCEICGKDIDKNRVCKSCVQKRYREKNLLKIREKSKRHYRDNKEKILEWHKSYHLKKRKSEPNYKEFGLCAFCGKEFKIWTRRKFCSDSCAEAAYRERNRKSINLRSKIFREKNKEKIKQYRKKNYNKEYHKKYREKNFEQLKEQKKKYYLGNREHIIKRTTAYSKKMRKNKEYRNKELKTILNSDHYFRRLCSNKLGIEKSHIDNNILETYKTYIKLLREVKNVKANSL